MFIIKFDLLKTFINTTFVQKNYVFYICSYMSIMYKYHLNLVPQYLSDFANIYRKDNSRYSIRYEDNYCLTS